MSENDKIRKYKIRKALEEKGLSEEANLIDVEKSTMDKVKKEIEKHIKRQNALIKNNADYILSNIRFNFKNYLDL
jgi:hypothetical protein